jgi:hypothetical protein
LPDAARSCWGIEVLAPVVVVMALTLIIAAIVPSFLSAYKRCAMLRSRRRSIPTRRENRAGATVARGSRFVFERELERGDLVELGLDSGFQYECWS